MAISRSQKHTISIGLFIGLYSISCGAREHWKHNSWYWLL